MIGTVGTASSGQVDRRLTEAGMRVSNFLTKRVAEWSCDDQDLQMAVMRATDDIGLRFRPYLFRLVVEGCGGRFNAFVAVAASLEMAHLSTLVVDDVLDESALRNGHPSLSVQMGPCGAISIGLMMYSFAGELLCDWARASGRASDGCRLGSVLHRAHATVYRGQSQDLAFTGRTSVTEHEYLTMIGNTTASLIAASLEMGAICGGAMPRHQRRLADIGYAFGLAYQLRDDVVDLVADTALSGKPYAGDIRERKMRLPVIHALRVLRGKNRACLVRHMRKTHPLGDEEVAEVVGLLEKAGSIEYVEQMTREHAAHGMQLACPLRRSHPALYRDLEGVAELISSFD